MSAFAQPNWATRVGAWSNDAYNAVVVDAAGSSYATGEFGGVIDLDGTLLLSQGSLDIVVAKYNGSGSLVWVKTFGGSGLDRGIALALGQSGDLVVTGQFMGTVAMGNDVLVSQGGTQDIFVLSMQASDGTVNWTRQAGGADGVDQPSGISVASDGNIAVTGEFRGTALFDAGTLTSMTDPDTGEPSVDIFVAAYAGDGTALWLKHGAARFADRGMDVVHDALGNVYVTGQFSDTLTFDATHNNALYNAVFIVRFNAMGEEEWFRVFGGGTYNQVFALQVVEDDRLMLVGDMQGTAIFLDDVPDFVTAAAPRSSFLLEVDLAGTLLQSTTWGSEHVVNTRALSVQGNEVIVLGRFQCQFTDFSSIHGEGTWLATGQHDLYVARFHLNDLGFKDAQQFGGQKNKVPGGIVHAPDGAPIFCGSFDRLLVFPRIPGQFNMQPATSAVLSPTVPVPFCADDNYHSYAGLRGSSLMDAFLARGWAEGRQPYDIFSRPPGACDRPQRDVNIVMGGAGAVGPDSLRTCGSGVLTVNTNTAFVEDTTMRHTAPDLEFLWSTGSDSTSITVVSSGWYSVTITSAAGCWQRQDSLYVIVDPLPDPPLLNDDVVVNTDALLPESLSGCEPFAPWLWPSGVDPANTVTWSGPGGNIVGDSIQATASGPFIVQVTTPFGCMRSNEVEVTIFPSGPLPPLDANYNVVFPQDTDQNDTISICMNVDLQYGANVELLLNGTSVAVPYAVRVLQSCNGTPFGGTPDNGLVAACTSPIGTEGWYSRSIGIMLTNAPCGEDTLVFWRTDSVYVIPFPVIYPTITLSGPGLICPGDTATVTMSCTNCDQISWGGPGIFQNYTDSIRVVAPGNYTCNVTNLDTNGCVTSTQAGHLIEWNPRPLLNVVPTDGIICPDSTALIYTDTQGTDHQWYGPLGPLNVDNDSIVTSQQGLYYLEMVDQLGCPVTSDPILVTGYATPYLNVLPDNSLCNAGETATLQVITTGAAFLQWWAPLSGNALQQVVDQPGVYTCSVEACGITTVLSVEIFGNNAVAELLDPGPFTLCPGEEVLLQAVPGMTMYYWLPGQVVGNQLLVGESGTFTLVAIDSNGCEASTETTVSVIPWTEDLSTSDTLICAGTPLVLNVPGSGIITWYSDPQLTQVVHTGNLFDLGIPVEGMTFYLRQEEGACTSAVQQLVVQVLAPPQVPLIIGPDSLCAGSPLVLTVDPEPGITYVWNTPSGSSTGATLSIASVGQGDSGSYTVTASNAACPTAEASHTLTVSVPADLALTADTLICPGGVATFVLPAGFSAPQWSDGSTNTTFSTSTPGTVTVQAVDMNGCPVQATSQVEAFAFTLPAIAFPVSICYGADATLEVQGSGSFSWFADADLTQVLGSGSTLFVPVPADSSVLYVVQNEWLCTGQPIAVPLNVTPVPNNVQITAPFQVCEGTPILVAITGAEQLGGTWITPTGASIGAQVQIPEAALSDAGVYTVVPSIGPCLGDTLSTFVSVVVPNRLDLGLDSSFCDGGEHIYGVTATDAQGCEAYGEVMLELVDCDLLVPNFLTPNGDGINDDWSLAPGPYRFATMTIFNRWGMVVWEGNPSHSAFKGLHYMSGEPLSDGVYYFVLVLQRTAGRQSEHKGYIQVTR
jgi:gliding motility-associated-like protein